MAQPGHAVEDPIRELGLGEDAEGLGAAMQNDDAAICGATTSLANHGASLACDQNFANWKAMLQ